MSPLIELEEALAIVARTPRSGREEVVSLAEALDRVLARPMVSPFDSPPFDKSSMDGFAVLADDDSTELRILETVAAGTVARGSVTRGQCVRIMTGAMLPLGTGRVIRKEHVEERNGAIRVLVPEPVPNVVRRGSSVAAGAPLLDPKVLAPQDIGILAAAGIANVQVGVRPQTTILCTGPEIRPAGEILGPGQIYDSNGPQLAAQLATLRCPSRQAVSVVDEPAALARALADACATCDLLLLTGGISAGDFDYVPGCLEEIGARVFFHGVAVKPGKPALFARRGDTWVFGLPGNPVSTFVIFEVLVRPFLYRWMGIDWTPRMVRGVLGAEVIRKDTERTEFLPITVRDGVVTPVPFHGSAHLNALGGADGFIQVEKGVAKLARGTEVDARLL